MKTKIFPAIDIIGGNCVRLTKGDYESVKIYHEDPIKTAIGFREAGASYLHVVDLDAAKNPNINNREIISAIIRDSGLKVQVGGGIRTEDDIMELLDIGAERLILGSVAVTSQDKVMQWLSTYGGSKIVIGADVSDRMIVTHGWLQTSDHSIFTFIEEYLKSGALTFLCTDIAKDGMLEGVSSVLYAEIMEKFPGIGLIASGGVRDIHEVRQLVLAGVEGVIVGKAIYEGAIDIKELFKMDQDA
ncbi:MAG: 1-(5-phosphoribosyl)-5-[(5-phosphoribosylamino)methylideneamino]imidazole-4-carboxamide isomerase [Saprospiraceae bacterium]|nr:1-(5-phosphoribosyl)-5-[(5-phosphoribosylamino)methylideneamino]imidazole-4-carboxamide isomerase [Saprospiraceae bacterium]